jgi:hypothetical protein
MAWNVTSSLSLLPVPVAVPVRSLLMGLSSFAFSRAGAGALTSRLDQDRSSESQIVPEEFNRFIRAFGLVWRRLGSMRIYVVALAGVMVILAAIGIWHLVSSPRPIDLSARDFPTAKATALPASRPPTSSPTQTAIARISPGAEQSLTPTAPHSAAAPAELEGQVEITKIEQTEKRGPRGETYVVATIGLASRADVEKSGVEIHVYFYDLTADNELRPTDAQVTYQWLTPVRDWSDPAPKYLAATYFKPALRQRSVEKLHYGGLVVRVFSGGKLQDEQSQPETLLGLFRNNATEQSAAPLSATPAALSTPANAVASASPPPSSVHALPSASPARSPTSDIRPPTSDSALPYGKPIPGKPGFLYSPYDPKFIIDVRGFPPGTLVNDPNTNKPFRVP